MSALAASTSRVELGQLVMCASFRNPALMAKMVATADAVSAGRMILGLGAGWHDPEYEAFGYPIDHVSGCFPHSSAVGEQWPRTAPGFERRIASASR